LKEFDMLCMLGSVVLKIVKFFLLLYIRAVKFLYRNVVEIESPDTEQTAAYKDFQSRIRPQQPPVEWLERISNTDLDWIDSRNCQHQSGISDPLYKNQPQRKSHPIRRLLPENIKSPLFDSRLTGNSTGIINNQKVEKQFISSCNINSDNSESIHHSVSQTHTIRKDSAPQFTADEDIQQFNSALKNVSFSPNASEFNNILQHNYSYNLQNSNSEKTTESLQMPRQFYDTKFADTKSKYTDSNQINDTDNYHAEINQQSTMQKSSDSLSLTSIKINTPQKFVSSDMTTQSEPGWVELPEVDYHVTVDYVYKNSSRAETYKKTDKEQTGYQWNVLHSY